ncbi:MAG: DNA cytosine methyltransferase, partial [Muribaculaceae bacterium]|nr:DNA cytosine methyltransferase [Muribaculaceae bacterium]
FREQVDKNNFIFSHFIPQSSVLEDVIDERENENEALFFSERAVAGMMAVREKMNKGRVQDLSQPCNTISAHLAKVSLNSTDPVLMIGKRYRRFSCREAARIQSFPDSFQLDVVSSIRQYKAIGNAVPPVMMWHIANSLQRAFEISDGDYASDSPEASPYFFYPSYDGFQGCLFDQEPSYGS